MVNFLKFKWLYALISAIVILSGLFSIFRWGYIYSIDFVGGTNLQYQVNKKVTKEQVTPVFKSNNAQIENLQISNNIITVRTKAIDEKQESKIRSDLQNKLNVKINILRSDTVGPVIGKETMVKTGYASLLAVLGILIYMSFAFKGINFALAAIIALIHDFLVVLGVYSLLSHFFGAQVDTLFVTAVLTSMSFSVHDTIIIFDKVREYLRTEGRGDMELYVNRALTETLVRSLNNSMTIIFMLSALTLLGGSTIRFFAATLLVGTITGTYSSPFVATPILVWLEKRRSAK